MASNIPVPSHCIDHVNESTQNIKTKAVLNK